MDPLYEQNEESLENVCRHSDTMLVSTSRMRTTTVIPKIVNLSENNLRSHTKTPLTLFNHSSRIKIRKCSKVIVLKIRRKLRVVDSKWARKTKILFMAEQFSRHDFGDISKLHTLHSFVDFLPERLRPSTYFVRFDTS